MGNQHLQINCHATQIPITSIQNDYGHFYGQAWGNNQVRRALKLLPSPFGMNKIAFDHTPCSSSLKRAVYPNRCRIGTQGPAIGVFMHPCDPDTITLSLNVMGYLITTDPPTGRQSPSSFDFKMFAITCGPEE